MQSIPLAVLKQGAEMRHLDEIKLHAIHTACGIETAQEVLLGWSGIIACNPYRLRY